MSESHASAPGEAIDLEAHLRDLDEQKLAALPDSQMVATINQRRFVADQKLQEKFKKQRKFGKRKARRPR